MSDLPTGYISGVAQTYTTIAAAEAAAAADGADQIQLYHANNADNPIWQEIITTTKQVGFEGMLGYQKVIIAIPVGTNKAIYYNQGGTAKSSSVYVRALTCISSGGATTFILADNTNAATTAKVTVERCVMVGMGSSGVYFNNRLACDVRYCACIGSQYAFVSVLANALHRFANCIALGADHGFRSTLPGVRPEAYNCAAIRCKTGDFTFSGQK